MKLLTARRPFVSCATAPFSFENRATTAPTSGLSSAFLVIAAPAGEIHRRWHVVLRLSFEFKKYATVQVQSKSACNGEEALAKEFT
jgi:hypothetical protein